MKGEREEHRTDGSRGSSGTRRPSTKPARTASPSGLPAWQTVQEPQVRGGRASPRETPPVPAAGPVHAARSHGDTRLRLPTGPRLDARLLLPGQGQPELPADKLPRNPDRTARLCGQIRVMAVSPVTIEVSVLGAGEGHSSGRWVRRQAQCEPEKMQVCYSPAARPAGQVGAERS